MLPDVMDVSNLTELNDNSAIEDFGSIEILCSDKTGTLTEGEIKLDRHVDVQGKEDESVLRYIYLNSFFQAGIKSPLEAAILKHERPLIVEYEKLDEIPFDFNRKRLSVVVRHGDECLLITKGEAESIFAICQTVTVHGPSQEGGSPQLFDESRRTQAAETFQKLSAGGFRALGGRSSEGRQAGYLHAGGRKGHDAGRFRGFP